MIDIIFIVLIIIAVVKGYQKGLIIALFSIVGLVVGLAAALKLSAVVAVYLQQNVHLVTKWLPVISFALVFFLAVFLVHLGGKLIEKTFELVLLGWLNRLGGIVLYIALYTILFSVFLFYAEKIPVFERHTIEASKTYPIVRPMAPGVINGIGKLIPLFKDCFTQLESFFTNASGKLQE